MTRFTAWAWTTIMVLIGGFQLYRGALVDGIVFLALGAALVADNLRWLPRFRELAPRVARILVLVGLVGAALVLALTPRHGWADGIALGVSGILVLVVVWPARSETAGPMSRRLVRTSILWAAVGIAVCVWELTMYLLGTYATGGRHDFPALSDLLDPLVSNPAGRIIFVAAWFLGGIALTRRGRRR